MKFTERAVSADLETLVLHGHSLQQGPLFPLIKMKRRMSDAVCVFVVSRSAPSFDMKLLAKEKKNDMFYLNFAPSLHSEVAVPSPGLLRKGSPPWNHTKPCSRIAGVELTGH